jgi:hypothetical protein
MWPFATSVPALMTAVPKPLPLWHPVELILRPSIGGMLRVLHLESVRAAVSLALAANNLSLSQGNGGRGHVLIKAMSASDSQAENICSG